MKINKENHNDITKTSSCFACFVLNMNSLANYKLQNTDLQQTQNIYVYYLKNNFLFVYVLFFFPHFLFQLTEEFTIMKEQI
jgi:hypothetical protein